MLSPRTSLLEQRESGINKPGEETEEEEGNEGLCHRAFKSWRDRAEGKGNVEGRTSS
jgi:hypothetical protein